MQPNGMLLLTGKGMLKAQAALFHHRRGFKNVRSGGGTGIHGHGQNGNAHPLLLLQTDMAVQRPDPDPGGDSPPHNAGSYLHKIIVSADG